MIEDYSVIGEQLIHAAILVGLGIWALHFTSAETCLVLTVAATTGAAVKALPTPARREARQSDATSRSEIEHSDGLPTFRSGRRPRGTRPRWRCGG